MGRPSNAPQRRAQIVASLQHLMAERGYAGASVAEIARHAGLNQGLVHYYFKSKQGVLLALVEHLAHIIEVRTQRRLDSATAGPRARLLAFINARVELSDDADPDAVTCWVALAGEAIRQPEVRIVYQGIVKQELEELETLIRANLRASGRSARIAKVLSASLYATIQGAFQLGVATEDVMPQGFAAQSLKRSVEALLGPPP